MNKTQFRHEMIRSELEDIVGQHFVSVDETDKLVYSTDWSWMPQMWLDRGQPLRPPDFIVHPGSVEEVSAIMRVSQSWYLRGSGSRKMAACLLRRAQLSQHGVTHRKRLPGGLCLDIIASAMSE